MRFIRKNVIVIIAKRLTAASIILLTMYLVVCILSLLTNVVARCKVSLPDLTQLRQFFPAKLPCLRTSRAERTPFRRIQRTGDLPHQLDPFSRSTHIRIGNGNSRQKHLRIWMKRIAVKFCAVRQLHHMSQIHDADPRTDMLHNGKVVSNKQIGQFLFLL